MSCIKLSLDSENFIYNRELKTVSENIDSDIEFYYLTMPQNEIKYQKELFEDMETYSDIKFNLSDKMIQADEYIEDYISFQRLCKIMNKNDYMNLSNPEIKNKYEGKYIIIHDEIPHIDNLKYIQDLIGYEIDCVHLKSDSEYFDFDEEKNELFESDIIYNSRRKILSYILDIEKNKYSAGLALNYGDKFKSVNIL